MVGACGQDGQAQALCDLQGRRGVVNTAAESRMRTVPYPVCTA